LDLYDGNTKPRSCDVVRRHYKLFEGRSRNANLDVVDKNLAAVVAFAQLYAALFGTVFGAVDVSLERARRTESGGCKKRQVGVAFALEQRVPGTLRIDEYLHEKTPAVAQNLGKMSCGPAVSCVHPHLLLAAHTPFKMRHQGNIEEFSHTKKQQDEDQARERVDGRERGMGTNKSLTFYSPDRIVVSSVGVLSWLFRMISLTTRMGIGITMYGLSL